MINDLKQKYVIEESVIEEGLIGGLAYGATTLRNAPKLAKKAYGATKNYMNAQTTSTGDYFKGKAKAVTDYVGREIRTGAGSANRYVDGPTRGHAGNIVGSLAGTVKKFNAGMPETTNQLVGFAPQPNTIKPFTVPKPDTVAPHVPLQRADLIGGKDGEKVVRRPALRPKPETPAATPSTPPATPASGYTSGQSIPVQQSAPAQPQAQPQVQKPVINKRRQRKLAPTSVPAYSNIVPADQFAGNFN